MALSANATEAEKEAAAEAVGAADGERGAAKENHRRSMRGAEAEAKQADPLLVNGTLDKCNRGLQVVRVSVAIGN